MEVRVREEDENVLRWLKSRLHAFRAQELGFLEMEAAIDSAERQLRAEHTELSELLRLVGRKLDTVRASFDEAGRVKAAMKLLDALSERLT